MRSTGIKAALPPINQCSWKCSTTVHLPGPFVTVCTEKRLQLPGFDQPVTFEMGDGPLAINQGYYVDSCSSAVCHFCTNIIFCFVNGPNI